MNLTQIIATHPNLEKVVYGKYPATKMERQGCKSEKAHMDDLRLRYAKRIIEACKEKPEYQTKA